MMGPQQEAHLAVFLNGRFTINGGPQAARARLDLITSERSDLENLRLTQLNNWNVREVSEFGLK